MRVSLRATLAGWAGAAWGAVVGAAAGAVVGAAAGAVVGLAAAGAVVGAAAGAVVGWAAGAVVGAGAGAAGAHAAASAAVPPRSVARRKNLRLRMRSGPELSMHHLPGPLTRTGFPNLHQRA